MDRLESWASADTSINGRNIGPYTLVVTFFTTTNGVFA